MLGSGTTNDVQYLIWSCFTLAFNKSVDRRSDTMKVFSRIMSWSFYWLYLGRWPTHDWNGVEYTEPSQEWKLATEMYYLAEGYAGLFFSNTCDLDFYAKLWRLENHNNSSQPCFLCPASLEDHVNWRNFKPGAGWIASTYTNAQWLEAHPFHFSIFDLPFIGVWFLNPDYMHCKYLGVDQYFYGSILKLLVFHTLPGDPATNMAIIWKDLAKYFRENHVENAYRLITVNMFNNKDFPRLKGRAAELRHLGKAMAHVFDKYCVPGRLLHTRVKATLKLNNKLEQVLDEHRGWNFQGDMYDKLVKAGHDFLVGYNACQAAASRERLELFSVTIKGHHVLHSVYRSNWIHPKMCWCFGGESFMKVIKQLHASCTKSLAPIKATVKTSEKFMMALHYQFTGTSRE
jgi:hypothetical protein